MNKKDPLFWPNVVFLSVVVLAMIGLIVGVFVHG